jgi:hypothetical protein
MTHCKEREMNYSKKNNWLLALNGLILLALLAGVFGLPVPVKGGFEDASHIVQSAALKKNRRPEAVNWNQECDDTWCYADFSRLGLSRSRDALFALLSGDETDLVAQVNPHVDGTAAVGIISKITNGETETAGSVMQEPLLGSIESDTQMVSVTIAVAVPDLTPGTVYIFGNQPELGAGDPSAVPMTQSGPYTWTIDLDFPEDTPLSFNFGRGSDETEETGPDGNTPVPAREVTVTHGTGGTQSETFTVANWRDPIVIDHFPAGGASSQPIDTTISVSWSQAMGVGTDFLVVGPDGPISGTLAYYANTYTYVFTPSALLAVGATYTVTAAGQIDAGGDSQQVPAEFNFDTMVPTSVDLVTLGERPTISDSWWWVSWPWLMVLLTAVSLVGLVWIKRRRKASH